MSDFWKKHGKYVVDMDNIGSLDNLMRAIDEFNKNYSVKGKGKINAEQGKHINIYPRDELAEIIEIRSKKDHSIIFPVERKGKEYVKVLETENFQYYISNNHDHHLR